MTGLGTLAAQYPAIAGATGGVIGLMVGSFLNVVAARLPAIALDDRRSGEWPAALAHPPSSCPGCGAAIRWRHNIPLLSYLLLRGRCAGCAMPIPLRYPIMELAGGVIGCGAVLAFGFGIEGLAVAALGMILLALTAIDIEHRILPDQIVLPGLWAGLVLNAFAVLVTPQDAIVGAATGFGLLSAIRLGYLALRGREGMGRGDPKLAAMIGAWLGPEAALTAILLAFVIGSLSGLAVLLFRRADWRAELPFGPALAVGAAAAALGVSFY